MTTSNEFDEATKCCYYVVDDAGSGRRLGADQHAIVRKASDPRFLHRSRLVGWTRPTDGCAVFCSVHSYLDVRVTDLEALDMARDWLTEERIITTTTNLVVI